LTGSEAQRQIDRLAYLELIFRTGRAHEELVELRKALESQRASWKSAEDAAEEERRKQAALAQAQSEIERRKAQEAVENARRQGNLDKQLADKTARAARDRLVRRINPKFQ
jgi:predicted ribosome quality control (RQC) complex YloA/Tae2 family protein